MKKIVVLPVILLTLALALPASAQQSQQQSQPVAIAPDLFSQATQLLTAQNYNQAVLDLSLFILLNPTYSPAYYGRAQGYIGLNDYPQALHDVDHALETAGAVNTPDYSAALYALRGEIDQQQQNSADALKDYTHSITIKPSVPALANRGLLYIGQSDYQSALQDLNDAISMDSSEAALYVYRGLVDTHLNNLQASGADYLHFFSLIQSGAPNHGQIQSGQTATLPMQQGAIYELDFTAKAEQYASAIAVARSGDVDPLMVLIDGQGNPLVGDDDSGSNGSALILNYKLPADGQYALIVGHSLGGYSGTILVQLQISDTPQQ